MKNTLETRLGVFFTLALIVLVILIEMAGGLDIFRRGYRLHALFDSVHELKVGDLVKMAGKPVGKVSEIDWADQKVRVTMKITDRQAAIRTDSQAAVRFLGLMGQNFVAISFGTPTAPRVDPDMDTELATVEQADLNALMTRLDGVASSVENMTRSVSPDNFGNLLGPFTEFFKTHKDRIGNIIANFETTSAQIAGGTGTVGRLLHEDTLYESALAAITNLTETAAEIKTTVAQARTVVDQVRQGQGTLGRLTQEDGLYQETAQAATHLREILQKINQGQGSVGKLVNDEALYRNARLTLQKLDRASESLEDQGPLSVLGIAASALF
ncbi:MAG TPA: MlaD family protein [Candidatus Paceibacterota bacterium]|nr:MCE family protein [Verrucomicrobiota bacterium]HOX01779.1 MlaD family protein [Verrucomicrobiota bacterium]HRZ44570.1 MlaD family protein [Candidatus Paceibacterota bacterium]HRZ93649.1 MlaD family protein [Candidatus Paceibacterota bacterium]